MLQITLGMNKTVELIHKTIIQIHKIINKFHKKELELELVIAIDFIYKKSNIFNYLFILT
jgi:hypothetical protein